LLARLESAGAAPAHRPSGTEAVSAALIREALDANRVDLYLQPVVGLPQRRTYFYEGFSRLRDADGEVITPAAFLSAAEEAGLIGEVDNLLLFRCVQIVRRLTKSDRRTGVFCNISLRSFADERFFPDFLEFMRSNSDLAGSLIFEIPQAAFLERSATAARNMARLADYGFRFSIDQVEDLNVDLAEMQRAGVRFAKIEAGRLIQAAHGAEGIAGREPGAIRAEDIAGLFARHGVDLVAEKIETEPTVVEVLDLDVAYAQGYLFGAPRPVREEVIAEAGAPERKAG
jgi:cyclic-di-GMP phosphodiesterase TipF (flagellum assembly factor)